MITWNQVLNCFFAGIRFEINQNNMADHQAYFLVLANWRWAVVFVMWAQNTASPAACHDLCAHYGNGFPKPEGGKGKKQPANACDHGKFRPDNIQPRTAI